MKSSESAILGDTLEYYAPVAKRPDRRTNKGIPGEITLHVSPSACSRRMTIGDIQENCRGKRANLYITEEDIVSGCYEDLIPNAVAELVERKQETPRAVSIVVTCIDDLLGTDHHALLSLLHERFPTIKFCVRRMDPIGLDNREPPAVSRMKGIYSMLDFHEKKDRSLNIIGVSDLVSHQSELFDITEKLNIKVRQIETCNTFDDFLDMGASSLNLVIGGPGLQAAKEMEKRLGIPYIYIPDSYSISSLVSLYNSISNAFGFSSQDLSEYISCAQKEITETLQLVGDTPIAVDFSGVARTESLARNLLEYGFHVKLVLIGVSFDGDFSDMDWLREKHPDVKICFHHDAEFMRCGNKYEDFLCLGFEGAYTIRAKRFADFPESYNEFGFRAIHVLMQKIREAYRSSDIFETINKESEGVIK